MGKILFLEWKSFGNDFIIAEFNRMGYEIECFDFPRETEDIRNGSQLTEQIAKTILAGCPQFVFSFNYYPVAAIACKACRVKYVSWVYDSPYILMYSQTALFDTNRIFVFDSYEVERLRALGVKHAYYLPMGAATSYYDKMIPGKKEHERFDSDVTFVGSMYCEHKHYMFRHLEHVDAYTRGYLDAIMQAQKSLYGVDILEPSLTPEIVANMKKVCPVEANGDGMETAEWTFANYFLARKVTQMERRELLEGLSEHFSVKLFTHEETPFLPKIQNCGKLDYYSDMPYAFKCAKINLNISLRSIHSGMPLRALDILGCGGFLISNYQSDFDAYFTAGEDYVYYDGKENLIELVSYYLQHEEERKRIAQNGYRKAKEKLSYSGQVEKMFEYI